MRLSYETLDQYLTEIEDRVQCLREAGNTSESALNTAHTELETRIGADNYKKFNGWLNDGSVAGTGY